jgi:hypothetical protein
MVYNYYRVKSSSVQPLNEAHKPDTNDTELWTLNMTVWNNTEVKLLEDRFVCLKTLSFL